MADSLTPPLHKDPGIQGCHHAHPPVQCRDLDFVLEADQATGVVSPVLLALHPGHQMDRPRVKRRSPQESQPAQHRVHLASGAAAQGWPHHKDGRHACLKQSSSVSSKKKSMIVVLQGSVTKTSWRDSLHRQESAISHGSRSPQIKIAGVHQWEKPVSQLFEAERHKAAKEKCRRQKERAASVPSSSHSFVCPKCSRGCASKIGLYSHQWACKNWPSTFPTILIREEWAIISVNHFCCFFCFFCRGQSCLYDLIFIG